MHPFLIRKFRSDQIPLQAPLRTFDVKNVLKEVTETVAASIIYCYNGDQSQVLEFYTYINIKQCRGHGTCSGRRAGLVRTIWVRELESSTCRFVSSEEGIPHTAPLVEEQRNRPSKDKTRSSRVERS